MQRLLLFILLFLIPSYLSPQLSETDGSSVISPCHAVYSSMKLDKQVSFEAFSQAYVGWQKIEGKKRNVLTLIDFSKPSTEERLYVFDMKAQKTLFVSHVAHGQGSGDNYATSFSNVNGSHQSSLGFYLTAGTYMGGNGYSLLLDGLEKGINDKARERAIVIHGAAYANPSTIKAAGRLGRSFGCPALPQALNKAIIDTIKDGSLLFIYAGNNSYLAQSEILSRPIAAL